MIKDHCIDLFLYGQQWRRCARYSGNILKVDGTMIKGSGLTGIVFPTGTMIKLDHDQSGLAQNNDQVACHFRLCKDSASELLIKTQTVHISLTD
ncbi:hypothetical protein BIZ37_20385 [Photobacterium sp. BZF1]|uniref:hypothetical protein n=1 Tax=Photobacterium sp. BZF1 TaxID=1904457 RepID=UPI0016535E26|nr:hypothetical protein [Photobacterium sp. BZF1]MBC7004926.1 hypothetical protein [Photobacterium sp. BZF1]